METKKIVLLRKNDIKWNESPTMSWKHSDCSGWIRTDGAANADLSIQIQKKKEMIFLNFF